MPNAQTRSKLSLVATNQILIEACVFIRNIIIARMLGAEALGEFIFLVLTIRLFAMSTDLAEERYIVRSDKNTLRQTLANCHFVARVRSLLLVSILVGMGTIGLKGIPLMCFLLLAGSALVRGFTHQGYRLHQRVLNFRPALYVEGFTALFGVISLVVLTAIMPTLEVVCAALLAQAVVHTALSHLMTDRRFRFECDLHIPEFRQLMKFGLPMLFTGAVMFWSMQGERLILSAIMGSAEFAHFSMLFQLALVPVLVFSRISITLGLPAMAQVQDTWAVFQTRLDQFHLYIYAAASVFVLLFVMGANFALVLLFGPDFQADMSWVLAVAIVQALRLCRAPQSVAAQALGQTDIPLKANLMRVVFVFVSVVAAMSGASILSLLILAAVGEGAAWAVQGLLFSLRNRARSSEVQPAAALKEA